MCKVGETMWYVIVHTGPAQPCAYLLSMIAFTLSSTCMLWSSFVVEVLQLDIALVRFQK